MMSLPQENGIRPALVDKKFLSSNATSHEWMFGAIAELIDNACDPDVKAKQFWIDVKEINDETCLTFTDDGNGMTTEVLHHMLSFGFSDKTGYNGHLPIGRYGNGFKSGSMRLGRDALVFTCQAQTMSVGMLSQTYLEKINAETVLVPIVTWDVETKKIVYPTNESKSSLNDILKYSLFSTERDLLNEIETIPLTKRKRRGTRIIIYHLARDEKGNFELDFSSDEEDIRLSSGVVQEIENDKSKSVSLYRTSLKKYISILYMRPPMQVFLRKSKVKTICIRRFLTNQKQYTYFPKGYTSINPIKIRFGRNPDQDEYGMMMYNRNRLIQAFRKSSFPRKLHDTGDINYQLAREISETVIGVVELDCLTPNHIKQNFQDDNKFRNIEQNLKNKWWDYCVNIVKEIEEKKRSGHPSHSDEKDTWVQCDNADCQKWRRLPYPTKAEDLPDKWFCHMNPDPNYNNCSDPEEPEEEPEILKISHIRKSRKSNAASISENSSPAHTSEPESPSVNGGIGKFLIRLNKNSGEMEIGSLAEKTNCTIPTPPRLLTPPHTEPELPIPQLTPQLKQLATELLLTANKKGQKRSHRSRTSKGSSSKQNACATDDDVEEIEEIPMEKVEPEIITIIDDDDNTNDNGETFSKRNFEHDILHKKIKSEPNELAVEMDNSLCSQNNDFRVRNPTTNIKLEAAENNGLAISEIRTCVPDMFETFGSEQPSSASLIDQKVPILVMQDVGTSPIPLQSVPSWVDVERLKNEYEQKIAELQWQKAQLQKELQSTVDELEHERERADSLENQLKQYETVHFNSQDSDVIILDEVNMR